MTEIANELNESLTNIKNARVVSLALKCIRENVLPSIFLVLSIHLEESCLINFIQIGWLACN